VAKLKILISSTCYDLGVVRSELRPFIKELGHESVMSDQKDITYDPDEHTHTSCINEVKNCDMVILIIGSRFGGVCIPPALEEIDISLLSTKSKKTKALKGKYIFSITQAEVLKAIELSIPIYTFILTGVDHDHHFYEKNKNNPKIDIKDVDFPSIENEKSAEYIFEFINYLKGRTTNNSIATFDKVSDIKDYLKGQWSHLFQRLLVKNEASKTIDNNSLNVKLVIGAEGYLKLLASLIEKSNKEVLFTSTKMAGTNEEGVYGKLQKIIIQKSLEFKKRNPKRIHYGIIDSRSVETSSGSAELRSKIPDIVLRFNEELNSIKVNFFIADEEYVVLRMNKGRNKDRYSVLIQNKHLAIILKRYFYALWGKSSFMKPHIREIVESDENTLEEILDSAGYDKSSELLEFLDVLQDIDENHLTIPVRFIEKIISADRYSNVKSKSVLAKYKEYCVKNILNDDLTIEGINEVKKKIMHNEHINYEKYSYVFFVQYFLANYFKAKHSLDLVHERVQFSNSMKVLDIGGGGGASSMALIDLFSKQDINIKSLDVVDISQAQLEITETLISDQFGSSNFVPSDAYDFLKNSKDKYDFILAGNFLCEANAQQPELSLPYLLKQVLNSGGHILVVERTESGVYESIMQSDYLSLTYYMFQNRRFRIPISNSFLDFIDSDENSSNINEFIKQEYTLRFALYEYSAGRSI